MASEVTGTAPTGAFWVHIGHGKTGTTALQHHFRARAAVDAGLLYPDVGQMPSGAHHKLFPLDAPEFTPASRALQARLAEEMAARGPGVAVLISSEHLCYMRPVQVARLARLWQDEPPRILYYIRRQEALIESAFRWVQVAEPGKYTDIDAFVAGQARAFDFELRLTPWRRAFGDGAIRLRLYDRRTCAGDIAADAEAVMGLPALDLPGGRVQHRPSLGPGLTRRLMAFDAARPARPERRAFLDALYAEAARGDAAPEPGFLTDALKAEIRARYADANARIAEALLDPEQAALFLDPA
ncbi:hypothetical protein Ga0609869_001411 [Rhodovulum iodosum]|uniref:Sulfotransferase family protein n=1 Tax=Rhodovulum iodosum TaxID=68291 RepID=A0ABV3XRW1_9RHOB|nr:hypothetical protein [Rhodovulum robiginosum]RSK30401.1 hypothetical protein EJA01_16570 [Rhodovulum robiginosum]